MILAIDLGTTTGWAIGERDVLTSGVWRLRSDSVAGTYAALRDELREIVASAKPSVIAYEAVPGSAHRAGDAAHRWGGLEALVLVAAVDAGARYLGVGIATWKRVAGLRSHSTAADARAAAAARWPVRLASSDEAVARWVLLAAAVAAQSRPRECP